MLFDYDTWLNATSSDEQLEESINETIKSSSGEDRYINLYNVAMWLLKYKKMKLFIEIWTHIINFDVMEDKIDPECPNDAQNEDNMISDYTEINESLNIEDLNDDMINGIRELHPNMFLEYAIKEKDIELCIFLLQENVMNCEISKKMYGCIIDAQFLTTH